MCQSLSISGIVALGSVLTLATTKVMEGLIKVEQVDFGNWKGKGKKGTLRLGEQHSRCDRCIGSAFSLLCQVGLGQAAQCRWGFAGLRKRVSPILSSLFTA